MEASSHDFVLTGGDRSAVDVVQEALAPRFPVVPAGRPRTVRHTWLDTFDWRLHRAGLTLEQASRAGHSELTLAGPGGGQLAGPAGRLRWPALTGALAPGELRTRLEPVAGIRALLPVARAVSSVRDLRVLNADGKTVAWLRVDETTVTSPAAAQLPPRLTVTAVRGYQAEAQQVAQALASVPGARPGTGQLPDAAPAAPASSTAASDTTKVLTTARVDRIFPSFMIPPFFDIGRGPWPVTRNIGGPREPRHPMGMG